MAVRRKASISLLAIGGMLAAMPLGAAVAATGSHAATTAHAPAPRLGAGGRAIVVLKDQTGSTQLRGTSDAAAPDARAANASVAGAIRVSGGTVRSTYTLINAIAATLTPAQAKALSHNSNVAEVIPDSTIKEDAPTVAPTDGDVDESAGVTPPANTCPTGTGVQLEPEATEATHADSDQPGALTARSLGYTGAGVTVAFMAEGLDIDNPDFMRNGKSIFTDYQDFSGDGTDAPTAAGEAFLDASAIGAQGNQTYDVSHFSELPLSQQCEIKVEGEAPGVNLVGLKVFGNDSASTSGFLDAIQYAVQTDHVNVLSQSFGSNPIPDTAQDVIKAADEAAVAAGTTVTVSSGDAGITNTIGSPATDPKVISVGASTTYRFDLQTGYAAARFPGITGWLDDNISSLSSAGFDSTGRTVNLVAPGELNFGLCSTDLNTYYECTDYAGDGIGLEASGGTSESAPTVAGVAALVIQAYQEGHAGVSPTPAAVKDILTSSADDIGAPAEQQGAGMVDAYKAVLLAKAFGSTGTKSGSLVRSGATQLNAVATPGTTSTFKDAITNDGSTPETVNVGSRTLGAYTTISSQSTSLHDGTSPKYVDFQGLDDNYSKLTFTVPAGEDRLEASIAYKASSLGNASRDRLTLVDPNGDLAGYSLPQGIGNYGHAEVADPVAGTWTAYITSRTSAGGGSLGGVKFAAGVAKYTKFGTVSPSTLTLAPGASKQVTLKVANGATPGDTSGSLVISSPFTPGAAAIAGAPDTVDDQSATTVPVTLRSEITPGSHSFTQTLTGGNGRDEFPGHQYFYSVKVAQGTPELNASVLLHASARNTFQADLVSPGGNVTAFASNTEMTTSPLAGQGEKLVKGLQLHTLKPAAGVWTLDVDFAPTVEGNHISDPFEVSTSNTVVKTSTTLPNSTKTVLKKGSKVTKYITVTNSGTAPEAYFLDPRLTTTKDYQLTAVTGSSTSTPELDNLPVYIVPADSTKLAAGAETSGTTPIQFDTEGPLGDPDIESSASGTSVFAGYSAAPIEPGSWDVYPAQVGPFGTAGASSEDVDTAFGVRTLAFDTSVIGATGDLWKVGINPGLTLNTVTVGPGQSATIAVKVKATGSGVNKGVVYVDDADLVATSTSTFISPNGNQVAAVPYKYTVGK